MSTERAERGVAPAGTLQYLLAGMVAGAGHPSGAPSASPTGLVFDGPRIVRLLSAAEGLPPGAEVLDFRPHIVAPGTIDVHTHGGQGCSFSSGPAADTETVCRYRASTGATALLPTITGTWKELLQALPKLRRLSGREPDGGAAVLGIHVEGPFLNPVRRGAIDPATMRPPSVDDLHRLQEAAGGWIKMMTIAPELPGALEVVEAMVELGIVPSIGHTDATYEQVLDAAAAGARKATHTFNAMRPLRHRDPGTAGAVLADPRLVAELIADGVHVHPGAMRVLLRAKGPQLTALVTDGVRYAGLPEGVYERPGRGRLTISDGAALTDDGTIAGSVSPMNRNLALLRDALGVSLDDLFTMAAAVPAGLLGLAGRKGVLAPGADADFAVYDAELRCLATFVGGRQAFKV
ncbi:MAG TPA: N-acetylglucosamine-6-phosphate deacetylase [Chloroflexota bacterium]|jgi:N-acetylglucosamine-6-phosphate deacetylase|nr:N-acetylglucosamine-6-phosphate deacetylase [Chloroflexota bacterium]